MLDELKMGLYILQSPELTIIIISLYNIQTLFSKNVDLIEEVRGNCKEELQIKCWSWGLKDK